MTAESTASTLVGWFQTQLLSSGVAPYLRDPLPMHARMRMEDVPQGTGVLAFSTVTKDTALSGTITEATGLSNTALDTSKASATTAEVGIMRQFTKKAERQNMLGPGGLHTEAIKDGVYMCLEKLETDACAEAANASTTGGGTSLATFKATDAASMVAQMTINKAPFKSVGFLHATAGKNLRNELTGSGAAWLSTGAANEVMNETGADGYFGHFLVPWFTSNLGVTSSSDKTSFLMVDGSIASQRLSASTGIAVSWLPEVASWANPIFSGGLQMAITMCYGLVEILDGSYTKALTIA